MSSRFKDYEGIHDLAEHLRIARLAIHLTQEEAANVTRISQSAISLYEQARREPYVLATKRMAQAYGVTMDWLLSISDEGGPVILKAMRPARDTSEPERFENSEDPGDPEDPNDLEDLEDLEDFEERGDLDDFEESGA